MRGEELMELEKKYRALPDEVLLDFVRNEWEEFLPQARELIQSELRNRGYKDNDIQPLSTTESEENPELDKGPLIKAAGCNERWIANQAQNILENQGIECFIDDSQSLAGPFPGISHDSINIMVQEKDLTKATELLDTFPPLHTENQ